MIKNRRRTQPLPGAPGGGAIRLVIFLWASAATATTTSVAARRHRSSLGAAHRRRSVTSSRPMQPSFSSSTSSSKSDKTGASSLCLPSLSRRRREVVEQLFDIPQSFVSGPRRSLGTPLSLLERRNVRWASVGSRIHDFPRGGGSQDSDDGYEQDDEEDSDDSEYDEESDEESAESDEQTNEEVEEEVEEKEGKVSTKSKAKKKKATRIVDGAAVEYDEPLVASPFLNLYVSLGIMFLAKKVNLLSPLMVRIARFAFITYLVILEAFVLYVRVQAKLANDRTVITLTNPLSSVLQSQLSGGSEGGGSGGPANTVMKNLASSFLSSTSTVMEYDLKQANSMQSGLIFNMAINWFLHFKMEQVQPLLIQSITGLINMVYSPLFQVYVMGRNLERPFPNPNLKKPAVSPDDAPESPETTTESESSLTTDRGAEQLVAEASVDEDEEGQYDDDEEEDEDRDRGLNKTKKDVEDIPSESAEVKTDGAEPAAGFDESPRPDDAEESTDEQVSTASPDPVDDKSANSTDDDQNNSDDEKEVAE